MLKTQLLKLRTCWEEPFISLMLHAFHTCMSVLYIFITWPFNNQKLLPELWCFNNSFWISRKFSRQPRVISRRRSKAALLASWNGNKAILQVKLKQPHSNVTQRPHSAGGIWKRSFICTGRPTVHSDPSRKRSFSKTLFKLEEFENAGFSFSCGKHFENGAFSIPLG